MAGSFSASLSSLSYPTPGNRGGGGRLALMARSLGPVDCFRFSLILVGAVGALPKAAPAPGPILRETFLVGPASLFAAGEMVSSLALRFLPLPAGLRGLEAFGFGVLADGGCSVAGVGGAGRLKVSLKPVPLAALAGVGGRLGALSAVDDAAGPSSAEEALPVASLSFKLIVTWMGRVTCMWSAPVAQFGGQIDGGRSTVTLSGVVMK
jgi:hypothetical protein